ncbi:hypothetical protein D779_3005 [Imhoffiella purpurea]|uniref:Uncharacterized protein n=1 Tax=Imhoffiella purpurea TaxID=1249627 RepID=W9V3F1_9GAMM|nr:hypothetical protein D779_3005 [Imhoffiella purpurea]
MRGISSGMDVSPMPAAWFRIRERRDRFRPPPVFGDIEVGIDFTV